MINIVIAEAVARSFDNSLLVIYKRINKRAARTSAAVYGELRAYVYNIISHDFVK